MLRSPDLGKLLSMRDDPLLWSSPWFAGSIQGLSVGPCCSFTRSGDRVYGEMI